MPAATFIRGFVLLVITVIFSCQIQAQLCTGSLGDPVVNITFGPGGSSYTPPGGYTVTSSTCPNDGFYTITSSTSNCFGNSWHTVNADHTGDPNGKFMLVNATYTPGDFFVTTVSDLCPNTNYEFASWIVNVLSRPGIRPNITFRIETPGGVVLNQFQTGDIPETSSPQWLQYGFYFTTPATNASIVLRMTNNAPGGNGNDLGLDDITFRPCGARIDANIVGYATDTVDVCEGNTSRYNLTGAVASGYISPVYHWQLSTDKGDTWTDIAGATLLTYQTPPTPNAGNYWYRLSVVEASSEGLAVCRIASNEILINVHPKPLVDAGPDRIIITGDSATLFGKAEGEDIVYSWSPNNSINDITKLTPTVTPANEMEYTLSATSSFGCVNEDRVLVKVVTGIYVPTAFTPNGDGKNDQWQIPFLDPAFNATVDVFNRYGQLVYHASDEIVSWDGKLNGMAQASGVYVYVVTFKHSKLKLKGTLMLIR